MCDSCAPPGGWTRRRVIGVLGAGALAAAAGPPVGGVGPAGAATPAGIRPRHEWAGDDHPAGPVAPEPDVRILVVHHTVNGNDYAESQVPALLRGIHRYHTGPAKGWPDIAYNFVVDRFGGIWETRAGSLQGAVAGDATGGSQGFDQKVAFLGDHRWQEPSPAAVAAMTHVLAFLADRHGLDTASGATATFVSRGSDRYPAGTTVTVPTISGHRAVSRTACPGDAAAALVGAHLPTAVSASRTGVPATPSQPAPPGPAGSPTTPPPAPTPAPAPTVTTGPPATTATTSPVRASSTTGAPRGTTGGPRPGAQTAARSGGSGDAGATGSWGRAELLAGAVVAGTGLLVAFRNRAAR